MAFLLAHLSTLTPSLLCSLAAQLLTLLSPALAKLTKSQTAKTLPSALLINAQKLCPHFTLTLLMAIYYLDFTIAQARNLVVAIAYKCPCRRGVGALERMSADTQKRCCLISCVACQALNLGKLKGPRAKGLLVFYDMEVLSAVAFGQQAPSMDLGVQGQWSRAMPKLGAMRGDWAFGLVASAKQQAWDLRSHLWL